MKPTALRRLRHSSYSVLHRRWLSATSSPSSSASSTPSNGATGTNCTTTSVGGSGIRQHVPHFDLVVIGSGPTATQCAIDSARRGKRVALVDKQQMVGGVCVHTGTIPSKTFREAMLHLSGYRHRGFYGKSYTHSAATIDDVLARVHKVVDSRMDVIRAQLKAAHVTFVPGFARFENEHEVSISTTHLTKEEADKYATLSRLSADKFLIACGTRPAHSPTVPCDGKFIFDSDQILTNNIRQLPRSLIVVGAGVIGMEYASMMNVLPGTTVTVVDGRSEILPFADAEIISTLKYEMQSRGGRFLLGETISRVETVSSDRSTTGGTNQIRNKNSVRVYFESGKMVAGDALLYTVGRQAATDGLNLEAVNLARNQRGLLTVNRDYQTSQPHIYAAGDCIGAPSLASTSTEQGRLASCHMWGDEQQTTSQLATGNYPYGIYTIPEISMVGATEQQLTQNKVNYQVGTAKFAELAKGQMRGGGTVSAGMLKILFDASTLKLYGVHAIGEGATEIIHIGQVAMAMGCTLKYFRDAIFNYPTLAEAYRVAALNGLGRLARGH